LIMFGLVVCVADTGASAQAASGRYPASAASTTEASTHQVQRSGYTGLEFSVKVVMAPDHKFEPGYSQVSRIDSGSPGEKAGLAVGDVIVAVNGVDGKMPSALFFVAGQRYVVRVRRGGEEREQILVPAPHKK
jgi:S1-C subfamily serine protease